MKPQAGKSFAVFGAGAVGLAGLMAAKLIPHLIDLFFAGRFPIHRLVAFYDFAAINPAAMEAVNGSTVKPVLRMPQ